MKCELCKWECCSLPETCCSCSASSQSCRMHVLQIVLGVRNHRSCRMHGVLAHPSKTVKSFFIWFLAVYFERNIASAFHRKDWRTKFRFVLETLSLLLLYRYKVVTLYSVIWWICETTSWWTCWNWGNSDQPNKDASRDCGFEVSWFQCSNKQQCRVPCTNSWPAGCTEQWCKAYPGPWWFSTHHQAGDTLLQLSSSFVLGQWIQVLEA